MPQQTSVKRTRKAYQNLTGSQNLNLAGATMHIGRLKSFYEHATWGYKRISFEQVFASLETS